MGDIKHAKKHLATISDFKKTFGSDFGQRVLWDLMRQFHMKASAIGQGADGFISVNETLLKQGERNVVLYILEKLNFNERILLEIIEKQAREERRERNSIVDEGTDIF